MKALCLALSLVMALGGLPLHADGAEHPVKLILKDGTVVKGDLLGSDDSAVSLQLANGKSKDVPYSSIKKAFNGKTGDPMTLGPKSADTDEAVPAAKSVKAAPAEAAAASEDEDAAPAPKKHRVKAAHKTNGRKVAGNVTAAVGGVVTLVGLCAALYGRSQMDDATSSYCPGTVCTDGYHPYSISGEPGYYTYSQYEQYYYGQGWLEGGVVVSCLGIVACVTGLIISSTGHDVESDALLHYEDGQLALGIPAIGMDPRLHGVPGATLGVVRF